MIILNQKQLRFAAKEYANSIIDQSSGPNHDAIKSVMTDFMAGYKLAISIDKSAKKSRQMSRQIGPVLESTGKN